MDIEVRAIGEIVESQELLNGTRTVAFEAASDDGWLVSGVVSWNRGLIDFVGEGDLTLSLEGAEVYATLTAAKALENDGSDIVLAVEYEVDGGAGQYEDLAGSCDGVVRIVEDEVSAQWTFRLSR